MRARAGARARVQEVAVRAREAMRLAAWTAGWLAWLLAGPASHLHALS